MVAKSNHQGESLLVLKTNFLTLQRRTEYGEGNKLSGKCERTLTETGLLLPRAGRLIQDVH